MDSPPHHKPTTGGHHHHPQSSSDLFSSAKVLAEATQASFSHGSVNKGKAAGAASDLLDAACQYGKLEDGKYGQYIEKAETYLDKYESSDNSSTNAAAHGGGTTVHSSSHFSGGYGESEGGYGENKHQSSDHSGGGTTAHSSSHSGGGHGQSEGAYGEYVKMAEGL
ncbi:hypothetical protein ACR8G9_22695, partial [Salmonella enterica subsp. enterica serovar Paratyphi A]